MKFGIEIVETKVHGILVEAFENHINIAIATIQPAESGIEFTEVNYHNGKEDSENRYVNIEHMANNIAVRLLEDLRPLIAAKIAEVCQNKIEQNNLTSG